MNRDAAIGCFLARVNGMPRLPFMTDLDVRDLYGSEVADALARLERISHDEGVCSACEGNCCSTYGCELYSSRFGYCPIFDVRPAICRFHFCHRFPAAESATIIELSEIFLYAVDAAAAQGGRSTVFFDPPPFVEMVPALIHKVTPIVDGVKAGTIRAVDGQRRIRRLVRGYVGFREGQEDTNTSQ